MKDTPCGRATSGILLVDRPVEARMDVEARQHGEESGVEREGFHLVGRSRSEGMLMLFLYG